MNTDLIKALRAKAAKGVVLTLDEVREFVAAARRSYLAHKNSAKKSDRTKSAPPKNPDQIDFF